MSDTKQMQAQRVYKSIINMLDSRDWKYERHDEDLLIKSGIKGEDLPIEFILFVDAERELIRLLSKLPFSIPEDKRVDAAVAVCAANNCMINGCFDFDMNDGDLSFRLVSSYKSGSVLSDDLLEYMILVSASTIDKYNDKFFMLGKGMLTAEQFLKQEGN
ncbi:MAG: YbjN domain-containing protein [Clostridia bacterium]|nr:YbjN domain-containing protein [Clostridia bacterium]